MGVKSQNQPGFRTVLQEAFRQRVAHNKSYSLRAFARQLEVDASHLAKMLNGSRPISQQFVQWAGRNLRWTKEEIARAKFLPDVSKTKVGRKYLRAVDRRLRPIPNDHFELIAGLIHYVILEMTELTQFKATPETIAARLRVPPRVVLEAVQRLKRVGALVEHSGKLRSVRDFTTTKLPNITPAMKRHQQEILAAASRAVEEVPAEFRDQSGITMVIDRANLSKAKERIKEFRRDLVAILQDGNTRDCVYQLSVSLFPIERGP